MPGPVFKGRCIVEVKVPSKTVIKNDCDRCPRTWFSDEAKPATSVKVELTLSNGEKVAGSFGILCDSCEKTVRSAVTIILKAMKKTSPNKSIAKKSAVALPGPEPVPNHEQPAPEVRHHGVSGAPSKKA